MNLIAIFIGGGLGSLCRYGISLFSLKLYPANIPLGTFISNVFSCVILALAIIYFNGKTSINVALKLFIITGFCGGFSTFSTFSLETFELLKQGNLGLAILNITISICIGITSLYFLLKNHL